jgi:hypothetical protein
LWLPRPKPEPFSLPRVLYLTMTLSLLRRSAALLVVPAAAVLGQAGQAGRTIDEGTFIVTRAGAAAQTESFKIARLDNGQFRATAQVVAGDDRVSSSLLADSLGTPMGYGIVAKSRGSTTLDVRVLPRGRRLAITSSDNRSNESMKEMPFTPGQCVILDNGLVHQLYFLALAKRSGDVDVIDPRNARHDEYGIVGRGLEPIQIGHRSVTATHYSLVNGPAPREFWVDATGRILRVEMPSAGLVAVREELPQ